MVDVAFITGAGPALGFGHAARCMQLAKIVGASGLSCGLFGKFSTDAIASIRSFAPGLTIGADEEVDHPRVAIIDRLFDPDDANSVDLAAIEVARSKTKQVICIVSGVTLPKLPSDVLIIGYQPSSIELTDRNVNWGLHYAPVVRGVEPLRSVERDAAHAVVALGGHADLVPLAIVCRALAAVKEIKTIEVLMSPVAVGDKGVELRAGKHQAVSVRSGIPDVLKLLANAGIVIASYGNLMFEALALGAAVCVIGQKQFQTMLAQRLARFNLCVSAGAVTPGSEARLAAAIESTIARRDELSKRAAAAIDGGGLERIAGMIEEAARVG